MLRGCRNTKLFNPRPLFRNRFFSTLQSNDLNATEKIIDLLRYEEKERLELWHRQFFEALETASLKGIFK